MKAKKWLTVWFACVLAAFFAIGALVYRVDPFMHYHKPYTDKYFYKLNNQRSQNDGIIKYFDYDAIIAGSSMTQNFRTTEMDRIFGCKSIKITFSGGSFKEVNDNIAKALKVNPKVKTVIRGLDISRLNDDPDAMRMDLGEFPNYLYDNNPFNDVNYLFNRDIVFGRVYTMVKNSKEADFTPGITSFDDFSRWQDNHKYGLNGVRDESPDAFEEGKTDDFKHLTEEEKELIKINVEKNLTSIAAANPDVTFCYFYTPYGIASWRKQNDIFGTIYKRLEILKYTTELMLPYENIRLYSFNSRYDIITDLNNYRDQTHYASWVNSLILKWIHDDEYRLTKDNYESIWQQDYDFYTTYDYDSIYYQEDYEADYYAGALLNRELTGAEPQSVLGSDIEVNLNSAEYVYEEGEIKGVVCKGTLNRNGGADGLGAYLRDVEYIGLKFTEDFSDGHNYLSFHGQRIKGDSYPVVYVYDEAGNIITKFEPEDTDGEKHHYVMDLSTIQGTAFIVFNGGGINSGKDFDSEYIFSDIELY